MANISGIKSYKTNKGIRYSVNTLVNQKPIKKQGFLTQKDAKSWLHEQKELHSKRPDYISVVPCWEEFVEEYRRLHLSTKKDRTQRRYEIDIKYHLSPEFNYQKLDQIKPKMVEHLRSKLQKKLAPKSVNNAICTLRTMLQKAIDWSYLIDNPVKIKNLKVVKSSDENWWKDESYISTYIDALEFDDAWGNGTRKGFKEPYRAALLMPLEIGPRIGEVVALKVSDVDLNDCTVTISKTYNDKNHEIEPTKNYETRILQFEPNSRLHIWLQEACENKSHDEFVFSTCTGKRVLPCRLSNTTFRKWNNRLGLPRVTFHGLRHTFATWYLKRGGSIYDLYKILGHKDINTTMRLYYHRDNKVIKTMSWDTGRESNLRLLKT